MDKVALVTGAGSGIGRAAALALPFSVNSPRSCSPYGTGVVYNNKRYIQRGRSPGQTQRRLRRRREQIWQRHRDRPGSPFAPWPPSSHPRRQLA